MPRSDLIIHIRLALSSLKRKSNIPLPAFTVDMAEMLKRLRVEQLKRGIIKSL